MNTIIFWLIVVAAAAGGALGLRAYVVHLRKDRDSLKAENGTLRGNLDTANKRIEALAALGAANTAAEKKADDEQKKLEETPDSGLAARANGLFGR